jgi:hypothetical protein
MNSEEIKASDRKGEYDAFWLKEIAYQLSLHNEREEKKWAMEQSSASMTKG